MFRLFIYIYINLNRKFLVLFLKLFHVHGIKFEIKVNFLILYDGIDKTRF